MEKLISDSSMHVNLPKGICRILLLHFKHKISRFLFKIPPTVGFLSHEKESYKNNCLHEN